MPAETTDTGSAFSYYESSSMGRSLAQDGGAVALEVFTGPVYGLVAALLEQDMARAPRDKRGHRFLDLFSLAAADVFQVSTGKRPVQMVLCVMVTEAVVGGFATCFKGAHAGPFKSSKL